MLFNLSESDIGSIEQWYWCTHSESKTTKEDEIVYKKIQTQKQSILHRMTSK